MLFLSFKISHIHYELIRRQGSVIQQQGILISNLVNRFQPVEVAYSNMFHSSYPADAYEWYSNGQRFYYRTEWTTNFPRGDFTVTNFTVTNNLPYFTNRSLQPYFTNRSWPQGDYILLDK
jgi:hypothetical protein